MKLWRYSLCLALLLSGCTAQPPQESSSVQTTTTPISTSTDLSQVFSDRDWDDSYDPNAPTITFDGDTITTTSDQVAVEGTTATITQEGTYILSGTLTDGTLLIDAPTTAKIQLVLNGVNLNSESYAPIYIREADKVFLTLAPDSENTLSNSGSYTQQDDHNVDAPLFCRSDLTLNGTGSLTVTSPGGHGIVCKDELAVTGGTYAITAASHGLSANDSVCIGAGSFTITSGKDGIQSQNDEDTSLGFVYLVDGTYTFTCDGDGISASSHLTVEGGTFSLTCGGGSANGETHTDTSMGMGGPGFPGSTTQDSTAETTEDTPSCKGLKAGTTLTLAGGTFTIDSADDALHANADVTVTAGTYQLNTGDDAMHADNALTIQGGDISIPQCYEGLEGLTVTVSGGRIALVADDDGLNAAGGQDQSGFGGPGSFGQDNFSSSSQASVTVSGGTLYVQAAGDGLDSNGSLTVSGGEVYVCCTSNGADSALDCDGEAVITGGTLVATGPSQMAQNFGSSSTQGSALLSVGSQQANSTVTLTDEAGETLVSWEVPAAYSCVVVSCPDMAVGESYTLTAGDASSSFTLDSVVYSSGVMTGQPGGNMGGMGGQRPGGGMGGAPGVAPPDSNSNDTSL